MAENTTARHTLPPAALSSFCSQVEMMLSSGIMLYNGLEALAQSHADSPDAAIYAQVSEAYIRTGSLQEALRESGNWPAYMVEMVGIGERTGRQETVMRDLAAYYQREGRIRSAIRSAVTYPVVLGVMMVLIILVMILKVLPVFRNVLGNLGVTMTDSGNVLMQMGLNIGWIVLALVAVMVIAVVVCALLMRTSAREKVLSLLNRLFPPVRRISQRLTSSRVASVLSMMLSGGFPLDEALQMLPGVLDDPMAKDQIEGVRKAVEEGGALGDALTQTTLFDQMSNCVIRTGCNVGRADMAMDKVAKDYENRAEASIDQLVSIIEPTLVGVLAVVIGAILLSVMLPMAGIISSIL